MRCTPEALSDALAELDANHRRRQRIVRQPGLQDFCSNDYLGLCDHPRLIEAVVRAAQRHGAGGRASHLINGHSEEHEQLEQDLAALTGRERALVFSTGYMANLGVVQALSGGNAIILQDRLNHASLIDAARLAAPRGLQRYAHGDVTDARRKLAKAVIRNPSASRLLVTDGVFSMDGDLAPLVQLAELAKEYEAWLVVDDAHGIGAVGAHGGGCCEFFSLTETEVPILIGTFGKALGSFGAFVAGKADLIEWLMQTARPYIYTTALPPAVAAATRASLALLKDEPWRQQRLHRNIQHFRACATRAGLPMLDSQSAIQPIVLGGEQRSVEVSQKLSACGFTVAAIRPPTVPKGTSRLRVTLSARHEVQEIDALVAAITNILGRTAT